MQIWINSIIANELSITIAIAKNSKKAFQDNIEAIMGLLGRNIDLLFYVMGEVELQLKPAFSKFNNL